MKSRRTIEVVINEDGSVMIDGHGFEGKECEMLNELAKQLGAGVKETRKPEYYKQKVAQKQRQ